MEPLIAVRYEAIECRASIGLWPVVTDAQAFDCAADQEEKFRFSAAHRHLSNSFHRSDRCDETPPAVTLFVSHSQKVKHAMDFEFDFEIRFRNSPEVVLVPG
jgi:hypothetical protein